MNPALDRWREGGLEYAVKDGAEWIHRVIRDAGAEVTFNSPHPRDPEKQGQ